MIYLDHAATALPRRPEAIDAARDAASQASPSRGLHRAQRRATECVERARDAVGVLVGGLTVTFHAGATAALNQAIAGLVPRPRVIGLGPLLHNAASRPARALGVPCWTLPHDPQGRVDLSRLEQSWRPQTDLVILTHGSNVTGTLQPVAAVAEVARAHGARLLLDAAQTAGVLDLDLGTHLIAFSAHKHLGGIPGTGVLAIDPGVELEPRVLGGVGFDALDEAMPEQLPARLEAGTPNLPGIAALGAAVAAREAWDPFALGGALDEAVKSAGLEPVGRGEHDHLPTVSVTHPTLGAAELEEILDRAFDIVGRAGLHCAPVAHRLLGTSQEGTLRLSAGPSTPASALDELTRALRKLAVRRHRAS